jgi:hypothetical protein
MATVVKMPKLGTTMIEGTIVKWIKNEGDPVKKGETYVEIQTDKVNIEDEAETSGILRKILAQEGDVFFQESIVIKEEWTTLDLFKELSHLGGKLLLKTLAHIKSGIIYDKMDYSEFDTLWSPENSSIFLGPTPNKSSLYGFYVAQETPNSPVEFQWIYNTALSILPEGERDSLKLMEKINIAFESLDRDMLLNIMYYVNDLKPDDVLAVIKESFSNYRWVMQAKGLSNWEQNIKTNVSYYPVSNEKITLMGDYFFLQDKISFRAELYRIGQRWKITRMLIKN